MSHVALRRIVIRLLHDPHFVSALEADPERALAGADLSAAERHALTTAPAAAWRTDPERPVRVRSALAEEFPVATGLAPEHAERFFASTYFHRAIEARGSLALAYGAHLMTHPDERVVDAARLETAVAQVRRAVRRPTPSVGGHVRLSPHATIVETARGASIALAAMRAGKPPPTTGPGVEPVLVFRNRESHEVTLEELSPELAALLKPAATEISRARLVGVAIDLGASEAETAATLDRLAADGVLV